MSKRASTACVLGSMALLLATQSNLADTLAEAEHLHGELAGPFSMNEVALALLPWLQCLLFLAFLGLLTCLKHLRAAELVPLLLASLVIGLLLQEQASPSLPSFKGLMSLLLVWVPPFTFADVLFLCMKRLHPAPDMIALYRRPPES